MKKLIGVAMAVLCLGFFSVPAANAGIGIGASLGSGFVHKNGENMRIATNVELTPFIKIAMVSIDLGIRFDLEELDSNANTRHYTLLPGARVKIPLVYIRGAVPIQLNSGLDMSSASSIAQGTKNHEIGFLVGVGHNFSIMKVGVFIEADANMTNQYGFTPKIEFRAGAQYGF